EISQTKAPPPGPVQGKGAGLPYSVRSPVRRRWISDGGSADHFEIVGCDLAAAPIGDQLELDLLAFVQRAETGALDGADMDEGVLAAVIRLNESEAFGGVEPLNGTCSHRKSSCNLRYAGPPK